LDDQGNGNARPRTKLEQEFNAIRNGVITRDQRFASRDGHLVFDGYDLVDIARAYTTPVYVFSEKEIQRNIAELDQAFKGHSKFKTFYASKACSVMGILKVVKEAGICVETNSRYEIQKCLEIGFSGEQICFNGVIKKPADLKLAIVNDVYMINVDSFYELELIGEISNRLRKKANVCIRVEPSVPSPTHPVCVTAYHAKSGIDLQDAEKMVRRIIDLPYVHLKGLHMHVGDQIPVLEPFTRATRILVEESARLERLFGIRFEAINVGGGSPVPYKYGKGDGAKDFMYTNIDTDDYARTIIEEVHKWRSDVEICIEPGRKVVSSAGVMLTTCSCEKHKTLYDLENRIQGVVEWLGVDAGYSVFSDQLHFDWYFNLFNASRVDDRCDRWAKVFGPLCDGGDYYHQGVDGEFFPLPSATDIGDVLVFIDAGAYSIESQTVYNNRPRTAVLLITGDGRLQPVRREDSYEDLLRNDIY